MAPTSPALLVMLAMCSRSGDAPLPAFRCWNSRVYLWEGLRRPAELVGPGGRLRSVANVGPGTRAMRPARCTPCDGVCPGKRTLRTRIVASVYPGGPTICGMPASRRSSAGNWPRSSRLRSSATALSSRPWPTRSTRRTSTPSRTPTRSASAGSSPASAPTWRSCRHPGSSSRATTASCGRATSSRRGRRWPG